jgi:predicted RNA-binding Zn-ribbon protein involved in translation (DUF1610 family)
VQTVPEVSIISVYTGESVLGDERTWPSAALTAGNDPKPDVDSDYTEPVPDWSGGHLVFAHVVRDVLEWLREVSGWIRRIASLREKQKSNARHAAYRKCPTCGKPDLRMSDRQRTRPDVHGSRTVRVKWLCLNCGYQMMEHVEEPN